MRAQHGSIAALLVLAVSRDAVWVGGLIAEAGSAGHTTSTVGVARYVLAQ